LENIVIYTRQGDFILLQVSGRFFIGVLSLNFYKNSHFDISKYYVLLDEDIKHISDPENYFVNLASDIRQTPDAFAHREVHYLTIK